MDAEIQGDQAVKSDLLKILNTEMKDFAAHNGVAIYKVYIALIDYLIGWLDVTGRPVEGWAFSEAQNKSFKSMASKVIQIIGMAMINGKWSDPFGDIFMEYLGNKDLRGQCFTPESVSNLCAKITMEDAIKESVRIDCGKFKNMIITSDPACGSGRMLLAAARYMVLNRNDYIYCIGEDVDTTCVKQTAINMALHGCYGEVICHDTLKDPDGLRFGYIVNEILYPDRHNRPTVRYSENPDDFIGINFWKSKITRKPITHEVVKPVQLSLFEL